MLFFIFLSWIDGLELSNYIGWQNRYCIIDLHPGGSSLAFDAPQKLWFHSLLLRLRNSLHLVLPYLHNSQRLHLPASWYPNLMDWVLSYLSYLLSCLCFLISGSLDSFYKLLLCFDDTGTEYEISPSTDFRMAVITECVISFICKFYATMKTVIIDNIVRVFLDQSTWETSINLPPNHGIIGLLLAVFMAFCIPFALGIVCGLGYRALESSFFNERLLNESQRDSGNSFANNSAHPFLPNSLLCFRWFIIASYAIMVINSIFIAGRNRFLEKF